MMDYLMNRDPPRFRYTSSEGGTLPWRRHLGYTYDEVEAGRRYVDENGDVIDVENPEELEEAEVEHQGFSETVQTANKALNSYEAPAVQRTGTPKGFLETLLFKVCGVRPMMSVVVAMDSFQGSLSARESCNVVEEALAKMGISRIYKQPMSDGGEGFLHSFRALCPDVSVCGLAHVVGANRELHASEVPYLYDVRTRTAVIEAAVVCGAGSQNATLSDLAAATSFGVGQQITDALDRGARLIYVGVGDVATVDGGAGMAQALGVAFYDAEGRRIADCDPDIVRRVERVELAGLNPAVMDTKFVAAVGPPAALLGAEGALHSAGFPAQTASAMHAAMETYATAVEQAVQSLSLSMLPGSGAGGGLGFALAAFCGAGLESGFKVVAEKADLAARIKKSHLVITGHGKFDATSLHGKVPVEIGRLSKQANTKCFLFAGKTDQVVLDCPEEGIDCIIPLVQPTASEEAISIAKQNAKELLNQAVERTMKLLILGEEVKLKS